MKPRHDKTLHRPFSQLKVLVENKQLNLPEMSPRQTDSQPPLDSKQESELFARAMGGVTPLQHNRHWQWPDRPIAFKASQNREEEEDLAALQSLIETGRGFVISQTGEYMEASGPGTHPCLTKRLHQGRYAIHDHIDLHGLFAHEAEAALHRFIKRSVQRGCRAVLVIHGRGLKSPCKPVLKQKVFDWLTRGPLRAQVVALASARACDGGSGATYVLLRSRPLGKKQRRTGHAFNRRS